MGVALADFVAAHEFFVGLVFSANRAGRWRRPLLLVRRRVVPARRLRRRWREASSHFAADVLGREFRAVFFGDSASARRPRRRVPIGPRPRAASRRARRRPAPRRAVGGAPVTRWLGGGRAPGRPAVWRGRWREARPACASARGISVRGLASSVRDLRGARVECVALARLVVRDRTAPDDVARPWSAALVGLGAWRPGAWRPGGRPGVESVRLSGGEGSLRSAISNRSRSSVDLVF